MRCSLRISFYFLSYSITLFDALANDGLKHIEFAFAFAKYRLPVHCEFDFIIVNALIYINRLIQKFTVMEISILTKT